MVHKTAYPRLGRPQHHCGRVHGEAQWVHHYPHSHLWHLADGGCPPRPSRRGNEEAEDCQEDSPRSQHSDMVGLHRDDGEGVWEYAWALSQWWLYIYITSHCNNTDSWWISLSKSKCVIRLYVLLYVYRYLAGLCSCTFLPHGMTHPFEKYSSLDADMTRWFSRRRGQDFEATNLCSESGP